MKISVCQSWSSFSLVLCSFWDQYCPNEYDVFNQSLLQQIFSWTKIVFKILCVRDEITVVEVLLLFVFSLTRNLYLHSICASLLSFVATWTLLSWLLKPTSSHVELQCHWEDQQGSHQSAPDQGLDSGSGLRVWTQFSKCSGVVYYHKTKTCSTEQEQHKALEPPGWWSQ